MTTKFIYMRQDIISQQVTLLQELDVTPTIETLKLM